MWQLTMTIEIVTVREKSKRYCMFGQTTDTVWICVGIESHLTDFRIEMNFNPTNDPAAGQPHR